MKHPRLAAAVVATLTMPALAACTDNSSGGSVEGGDDRTITVVSTDGKCELSAQQAPAGNLVYKVKNEGSQVTEFYLYGKDGLRIVGEVENIGPGITRDLVMSVPAGDYVPTCKPGMKGQGIRGEFTVTGSGHDGGVQGATQAQVDTANAQYKAYVRDQVDQLLAGTQEFVAAYQAGQDDKARKLYAPVRVHWERIEPVAESFGDLDPKMDLRETDLEPGQEWTGWHRIEKDLWPPKGAGYQRLTRAERTKYAGQLLEDTKTLHSRAQDLDYSLDKIGNGAKALLDEVATGKVTGEEEAWSHTDLYDFQANVDGARVAFEGVRPVLTEKDPALERQIQRRFTELQTLLDKHKTSRTDFVSYTDLSKAEVKELSDAVNALSEPLSKLTAAVLA